jgi:hypothetical protein
MATRHLRKSYMDGWSAMCQGLTPEFLGLALSETFRAHCPSIVQEKLRKVQCAVSDAVYTEHISDFHQGWLDAALVSFGGDEKG